MKEGGREGKKGGEGKGKEGKKEKEEAGGEGRESLSSKNWIVFPGWGIQAQGLPSSTQSYSGSSWLKRPSGEAEWAAEPRAPGGTKREDGSSQNSRAALMRVWCQTGPTALPTPASQAAPCQLKMSRA